MKILIASLLAAFAIPSFAVETSNPTDARMNWFREARFGMFIHWGLYSVPAGELDGRTNYGEWIQLHGGIRKPLESLPNRQAGMSVLRFPPWRLASGGSRISLWPE